MDDLRRKEILDLIETASVDLAHNRTNLRSNSEAQEAKDARARRLALRLAAYSARLTRLAFKEDQ